MSLPLFKKKEKKDLCLFTREKANVTYNIFMYVHMIKKLTWPKSQEIDIPKHSSYQRKQYISLEDDKSLRISIPNIQDFLVFSFSVTML